MEGIWLVVVQYNEGDGRVLEVHSEWRRAWVAKLVAWWIRPQYDQALAQWHPNGVSWISAKR